MCCERRSEALLVVSSPYSGRGIETATLPHAWPESAGTCWNIIRWRKNLEADQPVYALQARGLDGNIVKDQTFEEMVTAHLAELRSLQPAGPYTTWVAIAWVGCWR